MIMRDRSLPTPFFADQADPQAVLADQRDLLSQYVMKERPEHELAEQKLRYYCELPGDVWDSGILMDYIKDSWPYRDELGNTPIEALPRRIVFDKFGNPTIATGSRKVGVARKEALSDGPRT